MFSQGFLYGITSSLHGLLSFFLLPLLTVYYTTEEFGIYSIIILTSSILGAFFYFGASSALGRFYFDKKSLDHVNAVISATLFITLLGALIYIIISIVFGSYISVMLFGSDLYGFSYEAAKTEKVYFNNYFASVEKSLAGAFPGYEISIADWSKDLTKFVVSV